MIKNEKERREERLKGARGNDTWEYRARPPEDWNRPLEKFTKDHEQSILAKVQTEKERQSTISGNEPENKQLCVIL